jgi:endo-1,4-beta-xylanase
MQVSGVIARRSVLRAALAMALALFSCGASNRVGLDQLARRRGLSWGSAISAEALQQPDLVQLLLSNVGSITPENAFKWAATEPSQGQVEWKAVDQLMQFARRHRLQLRGHTLVWHEQLPGWLIALPAAARAQALKAHVTRLMQHTRGAVSSWDVINEPIDPEGNGLRNTIWLQTLGADYIGTVLHWARAAGPSGPAVHQ